MVKDMAQEEENEFKSSERRGTGEMEEEEEA